MEDCFFGPEGNMVCCLRNDPRELSFMEQAIGFGLTHEEAYDDLLADEERLGL